MVERYKIYEQLGAGGVGAVYRAYDNELKRWVAIKRLMTNSEIGGDQKLANDLRREADALAAMRNPNVVTIFDVASDTEGLFIVMELLTGEDLADVVARGPLHYDDFKELASQTVEALLSAHQHHILHRDIKPENIKVERLPGGRMQSKLIDFGLARTSLRARKQTEDQSGSVMGSIFYMAPEQLTRQPIDERTDLYSLGCVFYEALSGRKAFDGDTVSAVIDKHINHDILPLHVVAPHVPPWLGFWVLRLMAQKPEDRPTNAQQAIEEFRAWEKLSAAPQMMPWMPTGYVQMQGSYAQSIYPGAGSVAQVPNEDTTCNVPVQQVYRQAEPMQPVRHDATPGEMAHQARAQIEMAAHTAQLTSAQPKRRQPTAPARTPSKPAATVANKGFTRIPQIKLYAGIAAAVLVLVIGYVFLGDRKTGKSASSGGAASTSILSSGGPEKVSFELPPDRLFPPVDMDICLQLVGGVGIRKSDDKTARAGDVVTQWHDLSQLANDNFVRAFQAAQAHSPKSILWTPAPAKTEGVRPNRSVLDFHPREGKTMALNLTDPAGQITKFPFGSAKTHSARGLTLAIVFQADAKQLPTRVLTLSGEGNASVSLKVTADKKLIAEIHNGNSNVSITSKEIDPTTPCTAMVTWDKATGKVELRAKDAPGKTFKNGVQLNAPTSPLYRLQLGKVQNDDKSLAPPAEQFTGWLAEVVMYSAVPTNDQLPLLLGRVLHEFYIQGKPPPAKK
jgi:hypothetical protein